jgi:hypothetical protein
MKTHADCRATFQIADLPIDGALFCKGAAVRETGRG